MGIQQAHQPLPPHTHCCSLLPPLAPCAPLLASTQTCAHLCAYRPFRSHAPYQCTSHRLTGIRPLMPQFRLSLLRATALCCTACVRTLHPATRSHAEIQVLGYCRPLLILTAFFLCKQQHLPSSTMVQLTQHRMQNPRATASHDTLCFQPTAFPRVVPWGPYLAVRFKLCVCVFPNFVALNASPITPANSARHCQSPPHILRACPNPGLILPPSPGTTATNTMSDAASCCKGGACSTRLHAPPLLLR